MQKCSFRELLLEPIIIHLASVNLRRDLWMRNDSRHSLYVDFLHKFPANIIVNMQALDSIISEFQILWRKGGILKGKEEHRAKLISFSICKVSLS